MNRGLRITLPNESGSHLLNSNDTSLNQQGYNVSCKISLADHGDGIDANHVAIVNATSSFAWRAWLW